MEIKDTIALTTYLHELYLDRFPAMSPQMVRIWHEDLQRIDEDLAEEAVNRWAKQHTFKAPSLDELLEQCEFIREESRRTRRPSSRDTDYLDVLRDAAEAQARNPERSDDDGTFGHLMATLGERSVASWVDEQGVVHEKLTLEQRATQCYEWANQQHTTHLSLAEDLRHTARTYARIYHEQQEAPGGQP
jgi:hypothetical protein